MTTLYDFSADRLDGNAEDLAAYRGQVVLVVNTASNCGLTPQYEGLEQLHQQFTGRDFTVLGFPCNQFGSQEPGTADEIGDFCQRNYGVSFPMFAKVDVNGSDAHPVWSWLREEKGGILGDAIKWNFTKFLVGKDGSVIKRYAPTTAPADIAADIEKALTA